MRLRLIERYALQFGIVERGRAGEDRLGDGDLILRQLQQHPTRRIGNVGHTLGELRPRHRLDLVQHHRDDVVIERNLGRAGSDRGEEAVADRAQQRAPLIARAFARQALQILQCRHRDAHTELPPHG